MVGVAPLADAGRIDARCGDVDGRRRTPPNLGAGSPGLGESPDHDTLPRAALIGPDGQHALQRPASVLAQDSPQESPGSDLGRPPPRRRTPAGSMALGHAWSLSTSG